jgi:hypothetical protein
MLKTLMIPPLLSLSCCFAGVLWNGDPTQGLGVFKIINIEGPGKITAETDPEFGPVWRFFKPGSANRCEAHGAKGIDSKEGDLIFIGWSSKLTMPVNAKLTGIFQFKSYPPGNAADYPLLLRPMDGNLVLESYDANKHSTQAWAKPLITGKWFSVVLAIKESKDPAQGYIELWIDGVPQVLHGGSTRMACRTLDGAYTDPKWGVYHTYDNSDMTNLIHGLRIGTDYASVDQSAPSAIRIRLHEKTAPGKGALLSGLLRDLTGKCAISRVQATGIYFVPPL